MTIINLSEPLGHIQDSRTGLPELAIQVVRGSVIATDPFLTLAPGSLSRDSLLELIEK
jgi:hypothetical protein